MSAHNLTRELVARFASEAATECGSTFDDVINLGRTTEARRARSLAIERIVAATGCTHAALEATWGASLKRPGRRSKAGEHPIYDDATIARLRFQYGEARTAQILAGADPNTQRDIAAWRRVIRTGRAAA